MLSLQNTQNGKKRKERYNVGPTDKGNPSILTRAVSHLPLAPLFTPEKPVISFLIQKCSNTVLEV